MRYAEALLQSSSSTAPVQSNTEGLARLGQALVGGWLANRQNSQYQDDMAKVLAGAEAKPWVNPDTGNQTIMDPTTGKMVPTAPAGGYAGMLAAGKDVKSPDMQDFLRQIAMTKVGSDAESARRQQEFQNQQFAQGRQVTMGPGGVATSVAPAPGYAQTMGQNQGGAAAAAAPGQADAMRIMTPAEVEKASAVARATGDQGVITAEKMGPVAARNAGLTTTATEEAGLPFVGPKAAAAAEGQLPTQEKLAAIKAETEAPGKKFEQANKLRDEYATLTKDFRTVQDAYSKIKSTSDTGAGDMSLLYSYVKLLDPGSVVRESEFATAAASGSFGEQIQGAVQRVMSGQRLPPTLRDAFKSEADSIYLAQKGGADRMTEKYTDLAKRWGVDPKDVIQDYAGEQPKPKRRAGDAPASPKTKEEYNALPSGSIFTAPDGTVRRKP